MALLQIDKLKQDDFEEVNCFRCGVKGNLMYRRGPFGVVKCPKCGQMFISPRLHEKKREEIYENSNYFEDIYGFSKKVNLALVLKKIWDYGRLSLIRALLQNQIKGKKILEIGCAYGIFLKTARKMGFEVTGIEISAKALEKAKQNFDITAHLGTIEKVQLPENYYDVVCFWDVIEHVENPALFLQSVYRTTKNNGIIAFSCPYIDSIPSQILKSRWWTLYPEQHLWQFTPYTLKMAFSDAHLQLLKIIRAPISPTNLFRLDSLVGIARKIA